MLKAIHILSVVAAAWSFVVWLPVALFVLIGAIVPIVGDKYPWWFVAIVWVTEPLFCFLLWAAVRSLSGTIALTVFVAVFAAFFVWWNRGAGNAFLTPTWFLLPLLWYWHLVEKRKK